MKRLKRQPTIAHLHTTDSHSEYKIGARNRSGRAAVLLRLSWRAGVAGGASEKSLRTLRAARADAGPWEKVTARIRSRRVKETGPAGRALPR